MSGKKKSAAKKGTAKKATKASAKGAGKKGVKKGAKQAVKRAKPASTAAASPGSPQARDHRISREHAVKMHQRHVGARRARGAPTDGSVGGVFSKAAVMSLLQQPGAEYMRFYYGKHEDGTPGIVLAASDANLGIVGGAQATFLNDHFLCPPWCPPMDNGLT